MSLKLDAAETGLPSLPGATRNGHLHTHKPDRTSNGPPSHTSDVSAQLQRLDDRPPVIQADPASLGATSATDGELPPPSLNASSPSPAQADRPVWLRPI